jgi:hypothetical protein
MQAELEKLTSPNPNGGYFAMESLHNNYVYRSATDAEMHALPAVGLHRDGRNNYLGYLDRHVDGILKKPGSVAPMSQWSMHFHEVSAPMTPSRGVAITLGTRIRRSSLPRMRMYTCLLLLARSLISVSRRRADTNFPGTM